MIKYRLFIAFIMIFINFHVKAQHFFEKSFSVAFPNATKMVSYINIPAGIAIYGNIEIQLTGGYNSQLSRGVLTKRIDLVSVGTATGYLSQNSEIIAASEPLAAQWAIGDYDPVNSRIAIYHLVSTANILSVKLKFHLLHTASIENIQAGLTVATPVNEDNTQTRSFRQFNESRIGIGTKSPEYRLDVVGTVRAHEVRVNTLKTADFVFDKNYDLPSLDSVKLFIEKNKHLPGIPSAMEMEKTGLNVGAFQIDLLQKVEELTLHLIHATEKINAQEKRIKELEAKK